MKKIFCLTILAVLCTFGVASAQLFGSNYSMRLWLRPDKMAQYGLIPDDISTVLARQNIEAATVPSICSSSMLLTPL